MASRTDQSNQDQEQLTLMALDALDQALEWSGEQKIERTRALATCLAYLYSLTLRDRLAYYDFWKWLDHDDKITRSANLSRCLNRIYLNAKVERTRARMFRYRMKAHQASRAKVDVSQ